MTVLTKPILNSLKPDELKSPLVLDGYEAGEDLKYVHPDMLLGQSRRLSRRPSASLLFLSIVAVLVATTGITGGVVLYKQYLRTNGHRYQAYCSVPYTRRVEVATADQLIDPTMNEMIPLRWYPSPDVQIIGTDEHESIGMMNFLREVFDIRGNVERIKVYDNGRQVSFIHDFDGNFSGIVDQDRCFMMNLDPSLVLSPEKLLVSIEKDQNFDVSRERSTLRAMLPALPMARRSVALADCMDKPTYKLEKVEGIIRKRSADLPPHDYVQFAGQKVQEIEIANLNDLLKYELDNHHQ